MLGCLLHMHSDLFPLTTSGSHLHTFQVNLHTLDSIPKPAHLAGLLTVGQHHDLATALHRRLHIRAQLPQRLQRVVNTGTELEDAQTEAHGTRDVAMGIGRPNNSPAHQDEPACAHGS